MLTYADNGASHDYHGVTLEAERRFTRGLFFQLAYTTAKDTTETVEWFNAIAATRPVVAIRPDQLRDPQLADPTIDRWFDVTAFGAPPAGRFGTAARGAIESPGLNLWHLGLHKRFHFSDRPSSPVFRVEVTSTNIFNHPQFAAPNTNVTPTNVSAGRISAVGGPAGAIQQAGMRTLRLGLRMEW